MLEVGPGLGVLTRYLAERVAHVHAVELDRSLEPHLARPAADDAALAATRSRSTRRRSTRRRAKLVANLPYNIATPLVVESLDAHAGDRTRGA